MAAQSEESGGDARRPVKSAGRVLDVFELLLQERKGLSLAEISKRLALPPSSGHALVQTLVNRGYLVRDESMLIRLGPKLGQYARVFADGLELISVADAVLDLVNHLCGQTVSLAVLEGREVVFAHKKIARGALHVVNPVGTHLPAHATGLGKAMLALLSRRELDRLYAGTQLQKLTPNTIADWPSLIQVLESARGEGIAYDREESALGVFAVGSAIRDHRGKPVAAISVVLPAAQADQALQPRWAALVKAAAIAISYRLGYVGPGSSDAGYRELLESAWEQGQCAL